MIAPESPSCQGEGEAEHFGSGLLAFFEKLAYYFGKEAK
jgi:hypothetical protein